MTDDNLKVDQDALTRCMEIAARRDRARAEQLKSMLADRDWDEVAEFAAYVCQTHALGLKPWEQPPCVADEDGPDERDKEAQRLLRQMLTAGVSRYDPDPLAALTKAVEKRKRLTVEAGYTVHHTCCDDY
jgi:hypothetical protein